MLHYSDLKSSLLYKLLASIAVHDLKMPLPQWYKWRADQRSKVQPLHQEPGINKTRELKKTKLFFLKFNPDISGRVLWRGVDVEHVRPGKRGQSLLWQQRSVWKHFRNKWQLDMWEPSIIIRSRFLPFTLSDLNLWFQGISPAHT